MRATLLSRRARNGFSICRGAPWWDPPRSAGKRRSCARGPTFAWWRCAARLGKVSGGEVDATLLAVAGLARLGLESRITEILPTDLMLPAPAQGTIAAEARAGDDRVLRYLGPLDDAATAARSTAERALLAALDGSCRTPIAALAEIDDRGRLTLQARIIRPDGTQCHEARLSGAVSDAARIGREVGERLRAEAGPGFFDLPIPEGTPV